MKDNKINKDIKDWYLSEFKEFENKLNGQSKTYLHKLRKNAAVKFGELNFPTLKDEEWKYTNVKPILEHQFKLSESSETPTDIDLSRYLFDGFDSHTLIFINGRFSEELSSIKELPKGVIVDSLNNISQNNPELLQKYFKEGEGIDNAFNALNNTFASDGLIVSVPNNVIVEKPIQVLFLSGDKNEAVLSVPKNLIIAGANSQAKIIINYYGISSNPYLKNITTDIHLEESAIVDLYKIENEDDKNGYHIEKTQVHQKESSVFSHYSINFGGKIVRNDLKSKLNGENIECNFFGLYLASGDQHIDNHTFVDHAQPNSVSNELYKGILDDNSKGVFSGKILVRQPAQKTNAYQSNKTVLLSDGASVDTKPQLEIYADDVKCSHGATVGHLDKTAYFYILSRGIPAELAKSMLIRAFVNDVIESVKIEPLKEKLNHMIFEQLHRVEI
ncbi:MAG: Fe-S cluster assembly protein SufD [Ignavibacteriae bacterium]|jgi:Fe-S cluster assembly protein SufD|nr:Fe-S cluster assembly protein SufD [Ignavibacteriota bacterium]NOG97676.1 Fe-S cluster assembly protein SufD [Ignavibacteriota bacterium]